jgi:hypothetical protein
MNWRRGLLRLWLVLSLAWTATVFWATDYPQRIYDPLAVVPKYRLTEAQQAGYSGADVRAFLSNRTPQVIAEFVILIVLPPILVAGAGFIGWRIFRWIIRGFAPPAL